MEKYQVSWEEIEHWSDRVALKIADDCSDVSRITLVAVARGGLIPAQLIAYKLGVHDIRIMKLMSYDEGNHRGEMNDISTDRLFDGKDVYVIDDLGDSGATIKYIRQKLPLAKVCTLLVKNGCQDRPDICGREGMDKNTWLVFPWD